MHFFIWQNAHKNANTLPRLPAKYSFRLPQAMFSLHLKFAHHQHRIRITD